MTLNVAFLFGVRIAIRVLRMPNLNHGYGQLMSNIEYGIAQVDACSCGRNFNDNLVEAR